MTSPELSVHADDRDCWARALLFLACWIALCSPPSVLAQQDQLERVTTFAYHPTTGQLTLETVDPLGAHCVETAYAHDAFGNRQRITTRPCASTSSAALFTARVTVNEFAAVAGNSSGFNHPQGAYVTKSQSGTEASPGGALRVMSETRASYDTRFGSSASSTQIALSPPPGENHNLTTRTTYDALGRVLTEFMPVNRDASGVLVETKVDYATVYCQGPLATANTANAACINITAQTVGVNYASSRLIDQNGDLVASATVSLRTAYFIESAPKDSAGTLIGVRSRVHFDALHRQFAKETETYDGKWLRSLTGFDQMGMTAVTWSAYVVSQTNEAPPTELRQWTSQRDLLHRPTTAKQYFRADAEAETAIKELEGSVEYNGLSSTAVVTGNSAPGSIERRRTTHKNAAGQTTQTVDPYGATINMVYDGFGNLVQTVDPLGNTTRITYTAGTARFKTSMQDPDRGNWSYTYDALGQLLTQTDANLKTTTLSYDAQGRMLSKTTASLSATWRHSVTDAGAVQCASGLPATCESYTGNAPGPSGGPVTRRQQSFDNLGRVLQTTQTLDQTYISSRTFDNLGRPATITYPTGLTLRYTYSTGSLPAGKRPGFLVSVADNTNAARSFWSIANVANPFDDRGNLTKATLGNGVSTDHLLDSISGKAFALRAGSLGSNNNILNQSYSYDKANNLLKRTNGFNGGTETFVHDLLDRLSSYGVDSPDNAQDRTVTVAYNGIGNILRKSDLGGYYYSGTRPHAVSYAAGTYYSYDGNGNLTSTVGAQQRTQTWTDFNLPDTLVYNGKSVAFKYDERHQRVKETIIASGTTRQLWLMHPDNAGGLGFEREETSVNGVVTRNENRHYISVGGSVVGVVKTLNANAAGAMAVAASCAGPVQPAQCTDASLVQYWHKDSLGSIVAVSNGVGNVLERPGFDAWGRRLLENRAIDTSATGPAHGDRGYTGHEHLDELGLVHMNGRVYDPVLARFLSPDPLIQSPGDLQNYNLYSYVLNNPLRYTDPDGQCIDGFTTAACVALFVGGAVLAHEGNEYWRIVGQLMMMVATAGTSGQAGLVESGLGAIGITVAGPVNAAIAAGISTAAGGGSADEIAMSMIFASAYSGAGLLAEGGKLTAQQLMMHMLIGCVQGSMAGGECGPGAVTAGVSKLATYGMSVSGADRVTNGVLTTLLGGTLSVLGGGRFANGALSSGMGYLFNAMSGGLEAVRAGIRGFARFSQDLAGAGFDIVGEEIWGRTGAGERFRVDGVAVSTKGDAVFGHSVAVCEAKCGTTAEMSARQLRVYAAVNKGDFHLEGPKATALANRLGLEVDHGKLTIPANRFVGVYLGVYEGSAAHMRPRAQATHNAVFGPLSRGGREY